MLYNRHTCALPAMSVSKTALADHQVQGVVAGTGFDLLVREPHRHRTADLSKAKLSAV